MGKATSWLRSLLGMEKAENREKVTNCGERREKKRWSFAKSRKNSGLSRSIADNIPAAANDTTTWLRRYVAETEKEQNAHAVAVAAATAAAADAAIVAAQAAVAVVRLTSRWNGAALFAVGREKRAEVAAVKIQTLFRGYLARKALRALKGVVKLQALVRGFLVRKRPVTTLHSIEALIRAQASLSARRARRSTVSWRHDEKGAEYNYPSKSLPGFDDSPKIVEVDPGRPGSRSRRINPCMHPDYADAYRCYNAISAPLPCPIRGRRPLNYKFPTTQNTPRLACSGGGTTPAAKNFGGDRLYKACANFNCPGYMANTQSYKAKLRSESAPRQRPDCGPKKRLSLAQIIMASRSSFSGV